MTTNLSTYNNDWYQPGNAFKRIIWHYTSIIFFQNGMFPFSAFKVLILKLFGAKVGKKILIKPNVFIKYPWKLHLGSNIWIGEKVWIDNLDVINISDNVCLSQGAYLLTGNHNYTQPTFDLIIKPISLEEGVWIGAQSTVCPGVICRSHSVLTVGSIATKELEPYCIYQGNPAIKVKERMIASKSI